MGSFERAVITGFVCRLCSKMNRFVIHVYGEEGQRLALAKKINSYLPITIYPDDALPKTVCYECIHRLETHHELMEQFQWARSHLQPKLNAAAVAAAGAIIPENERCRFGTRRPFQQQRM